MKKLIIFASVCVLAAVILVYSQSAQAGSPISLNGWAWSSNIGWISFNSADAGAGGGPYSVTVATSSASPKVADFSGYAWSSNIGWIKFGGLSGYPTGGTKATVNLETGEVAGFVRACAGTVKSGDDPVAPTQPGDCSTMTSRQDGWDGWIELSGGNHTSPDSSGYMGTSTKGVTMNPATGVFSGYAWGGNVVGWVDFHPSAVIVENVHIPDCCGGGTSLIISCKADSTDATGVNFSATASGGTIPYSYKWEDLSTNTTDRKNGSGTVNNSVIVTDSATPPAIAGNACSGTITGALQGFQLKIGSTPLTATNVTTKSQPFIVKVGKSVALKWVINLDPVYTDTCNKVVDKGTWNGTWMKIPTAENGSNGNVDITSDTSGKDTGSYEFSIACPGPDSDHPNQTASAYLKLIYASEGER